MRRQRLRILMSNDYLRNISQKWLTFLMIGFISFGLSQATHAAKEVAKAIILKGKVFESFVNQEGKTLKRVLKRGDNVHEGAKVTCDSGAFLKLLFFDKSQMMVSPNSTIEIKSFTKEKAGMIDLLKGQIRSKVTKDRMNINRSDTSKLFIKTKTAAMGVRGTDFQVIYNPKNTVTSLLTFEGAVAMAKIQDNVKYLDQNSLESRLNSDEAVMVRRGQFSGSMPGQNRVTLPVKISPAQLEVLRGKDEVSQGKKDSKKKDKKKVVRSTVPPGLNAKKVATKKENIIQNVAEKKLGINKSDLQRDSLDNSYFEDVQTDIPPEGMVDTTTGAYAPPAGGYIDAETALYIPPEKGNAFDATTGVYVPGPEVGTIDPVSGDYLPPEGTKLSDNGQLVKSGGTRAPASVGGNPKANIVKNINQNGFHNNAPSHDLSYESQSTKDVGTAIDFNDYKKETVIRYNDNTDILDKRTREIQRRKVRINVRR